MKVKMIWSLCSLIFLLGCQETKFKESKTFAGNKVVSSQHLNLGYLVYTEYCVSCHGVEGDGKGIAAKGMWPPPRNFKLGLYKFGYVIAGELPSDKDFHRIIKNGLHGTAMLKWDMSDDQIDAVTQYIKTFAPEVWEKPEQEIGTELTLTEDPFKNNPEEGIALGKEVYHAVANCQSCHSAYATKDELKAFAKKYKQDPPEFDETLYKIKLQDSDHGYKALPPDYTYHPVRSASTVEELYLRLAAGVGGTSMPSWKDVIEDQQMWAVAYYVRSLMDLKDVKAREELFSKLENQ